MISPRPLLLCWWIVALACGCAVSHGETDAAVPDDGGIDAGGCGELALCYPPGACCGPRDGTVATCVDGHSVCPPGQSFECRRDPSCTTSDAGGVSPASCVSPSECVVVPASCCGSCGAATPTDMTGVNVNAAGEYRSSVCSGGMGCPACFVEQDPALVATCDAGMCRAIDLHTSALTDCSTDSDCVLIPADCCACGDAFIALSADRGGDYRALVCDPGADCPPCGPPTPPAGTSALCDPTTHHCSVFIGG